MIFRGFSPQRRLRRLVFLLIFGGVQAFLALSPLPVEWAAPALLPYGIEVKGVSGSLIEGWGFEELHVGKGSQRLSFRNARLQMDFMTLVREQRILFSKAVADSVEVDIAKFVREAPLAEPIENFHLLLNVPVTIQDVQVGGGRILSPYGEATITSASISGLQFSPLLSAIEWQAFKLDTNLGEAEGSNGQLKKYQLFIQDLNARAKPGLFPQFLRAPASIKGDLKFPGTRLFHNDEGNTLSAFSGKLQLQIGADRLHVRAKELELPKQFVFDFPVSLKEGEMEVPFFKWSSAEEWRKVLSQQAKSMTFAFGKSVLSYQAACDCLTDDQGRIGIQFNTVADKQKIGVNLFLNEYRSEAAMASDEGIFAELGWGKQPADLPPAVQKQIKRALPLLTVVHPPPLPSTHQTLLMDFKFIRKSRKSPESARVMGAIRRSTKEAAPLPVLYFGGLLAIEDKKCEQVPAWMAEVSARAHDPLLIGKSFAVLSQCEPNVKKRIQLAEMAKSYLPKDPYIEALLLKLQVEQTPSIKNKNRAKSYIRKKTTDKDLALLVIESMLLLAARERSLFGTIEWAKEKYAITEDPADFDFLTRLEKVASSQKPEPSSRPRTPASSKP